MYWTLRKCEKEVKVHSRFKMILLLLMGWKLCMKFEGLE